MTLVWAGLVLGFGFGVASRLGRFCLQRGLREAHAGQGDAPALRAFALALAVALAATQALVWGQQVDLSRAAVVRSAFAVPGTLIGGVLFGLGMVMARSCGARALVLLAGGNLRALAVLTSLGLAAQATLTGVLAPVRQTLLGWGQVTLAADTLPDWFVSAGLSASQGIVAAAALPVILLLAFSLRSGTLRRSPVEVVTATLIGLFVAQGWWITSHIEVDPFDPVAPTSLSFIAPVAESLLYLQVAVGRGFSLGPAIVLGTLLGACAAALATRRFALEGFDSPKRLLASIAGGMLMGFGGVLSVGCSIGQGLSGLSTLALASVPACVGILAGAHVGLYAENSLSRLEKKQQ
jgi:uncharacterized protein